MSRISYRAIFISDVHLGTKAAQSEFLLNFLSNTDSEYLYLVGDIFDLWNMKSGYHWPNTNNEIIQTVLRKARCGTKVVYIPGNHDERLRDFADTLYSGVLITESHTHITADGKRLLLIHGDEFDSLALSSPWLIVLGDWSYLTCLWLNRHFNNWRRILGFPYWSLSQYLKCRIKNAMVHIGRFMEASITEARLRGFDGVVCGHIHHADIDTIDDTLYCNTGDWVENCTALAEDEYGRLRIIRWAQECLSLAPENSDDLAITPEHDAVTRKVA